MNKHQLIMRMALDGASYREIYARTAASHSTISKLHKVLQANNITSRDRLAAFSDSELAGIIGDGRLQVSDDFVILTLSQ